MSAKPLSGARRRSAPTASSRLVVVLGDQLSLSSRLILDLGPDDTVLMMEVAEESLHVSSHVQRTGLFLSAMRHFAAELIRRGRSVRYVALDDPANTGGFETELSRAVSALKPCEIVCIEPGDHRVSALLERAAATAGVPLVMLPDEHFLTTSQQFSAWAEGRASLTMEFFYREQRRRTGYLMEGSGRNATPEGGVWNFDKENRLPFGKEGPSPRPHPPLVFAPDAITRSVFAAIRRVLPNLPGASESFGCPVTREQALASLADFVTHRLARFGPFEDAMWSTEPMLYHSGLSSALNLKLLDPRECCAAAVEAYRKGTAPLQSVEAFVRQIIGWREFVRGVYRLEGPDYAQRNGLGSRGALPAFYWTADTDMVCMRTCVGQVLETGFGHHIQRLMVTGNFALISGVAPQAVSDWYLGMFVDGVDWVTLPNVLGMVMHADRRVDAPPSVTGLVGTKPYAATGKYIQRMSDYCTNCRYDPGERTGKNACPVTVFYWDFLLRTRKTLARNHRMAMILKNVDRLSPEERARISSDADRLRREFGVSSGVDRDA